MRDYGYVDDKKIIIHSCVFIIIITSGGVPGKSDLGKANSFCKFFSTVAQSLKQKTFLLRQFVWQAPSVISPDFEFKTVRYF